jgi:hypothetical protein
LLGISVAEEQQVYFAGHFLSLLQQRGVLFPPVLAGRDHRLGRWIAGRDIDLDQGLSARLGAGRRRCRRGWDALGKGGHRKRCNEDNRGHPNKASHLHYSK